MTPPSKTRIPPESIRLAYLDLMYQTFTLFRSQIGGKVYEPAALWELADALRDVPSMLLDYGASIDDEKYRRIYLRPFDERWSHQGPGYLERSIEQAIQTFSEREPSVRPPESVLRAYLHLLHRAFLFLRVPWAGQPAELAARRDLADALHNVPSMLQKYDAWISDEKFRRIYLRSFDKRWGQEIFSLEKTIEENIDQFNRSRHG